MSQQKDTEKAKAAAFLKKIRKTVRQMRLAKGISQAELAHRARLSSKYISRLEGSKTKLVNPSAICLFDLVHALDVSLEGFFNQIDPEK